MYLACAKLLHIIIKTPWGHVIMKPILEMKNKGTEMFKNFFKVTVRDKAKTKGGLCQPLFNSAFQYSPRLNLSHYFQGFEIMQLQPPLSLFSFFSVLLHLSTFLLFLFLIVILVIQTEKPCAIKDNNSEQSAILKMIYMQIKSCWNFLGKRRPF